MTEERSRYYDRGYVDYHRGLDENPYDDNTFAAQQWEDGHDDADAEYAEDIRGVN